MLRQAFVEVDEEGTEAAAATGVVMCSAAMPVVQTPPIVFNADHPFMFVIRDTRSNTVLFIGHVHDPAK